MSKNKWVRSISFNKANDKDINRLKLIGKKSFSRYIKKLLDDELQRQATTTISSSNSGTPQHPKKVIPRISGPIKPTINPMLQNQRR
jgi:hypothetical protein